MAGFLGNYIHYRAINYLKYGTTMSQKKMGRTLNMERIIKEKHNAIQAQFYTQKQDKFKEEYQKMLNYTFGNEGTMVSAQDEENSLEKNFAELVQEKFPEIIANYASLDSGIKNIKDINIQKQIMKGESRIPLTDIEKRIKELKILMRNNILKNRYTEKELQHHKMLLNKISATYQMMEAQSKDDVYVHRAYVALPSPKGGKMRTGIDLAKLDLEQRSFFSDLNFLIHAYNVSNKSRIQKELGELSAAFVGAKLQGIGANELKDFINKSLVKGGKGKVTVDYSKAFVDLAKFGEEQGWEYNSETGGVMRATAISKNKIQVQIDTPEGEKSLIVKNYNLKQNSSISLMSDTSFLSLIENENQNDFVNHYFNITAEHPMKGDTIAPLIKVRDQMHSLIKEILLVNALTGVITGRTVLGEARANRNKTDYFVINDSSRPGKFKIFTLSEILGLNMNQNQSGFAKFAKVSGYNNPEWDNTWAESGPQERITKILLQAHQMKISAGIAASAIK